MTQFVENVLIGLVTGLFAGLVTGLYSGLIVSRIARFNSLRSEGLRTINSIEYMEESNGHIIVDRKQFSSLTLIASELLHFGHTSAGMILAERNQKIADVLWSAEQGTLKFADLESELKTSYKTVRGLAPTLWVFFPLGKI